MARFVLFKKGMWELMRKKKFLIIVPIVVILIEAKNRGEDPFILILDGIEDPHNLGSIISTAECSRSSWNYYS